MQRDQKSKLKATVVAGALVAMCLALPAMNLPAQTTRKVLSSPTPDYPAVARQHSIVGTVKVQIVIAADGHIKETKVIGGHALFVAAVLEKLKSWQYAPASEETTATLEFNFHP